MARLASVPASLQQSGIRKMLEKAWVLQSQGQRVISLCVGQPDFPTPPHIVAAAQNALAEGHTKYIASAGLPSLRAAVAEHYAKRAPQRAHSSEKVLISHGSMFSFSAAFMALLDPGDEVRVYSSPRAFRADRPSLTASRATIANLGAAELPPAVARRSSRGARL